MMDFNSQINEALDLMHAGKQNLFITGKAGTGKSTLLRHFIQSAHQVPVVLAPTGVAALNVGGQTVHSFFNFKIDVTPEKIKNKEIKPRRPKMYQKLTRIIIDEVSMLRADLLDCIDAFLRIYGPEPDQAFGGVQMIFIGDLYQIPPVVTGKEREIFENFYTSPYFFSAKSLQDLPLSYIELQKVYRQKDQDFIDLLNRLRHAQLSPDDIKQLNKRYVQNFMPENGEFYIHLTTTNQEADLINQGHLSNLKGKTLYTQAQVTGDFGKEYFPTALDLHFKIGAQVMLLNNDSQGQWVNGSIALIEHIRQDTDEIYVDLRLQQGNHLVTIKPYTWEVYRFTLQDKTIVSEPVGTFTQLPFRLAWAVTIHKSQGQTFEKVIVDLGPRTFTAGQSYVALSRATSLEGLILSRPLGYQHIKTDLHIGYFLKNLEKTKNEALK